jgi:peptidoglycan/xylan/chitin deacetylase (PgdA/CDA1 family)
VKSLICLTYDDALPVHRTHVAPLLTSLRLHGTFYVPAACDDLHHNIDDWRMVAKTGHELGNHTCWHPCLMRPGWDWLLPAYRLETYDRQRIRDEVVMANRVLHLIDGRTERSYAAAGGDTKCGPEPSESFIDDIQSIFPIMRNGLGDEPTFGKLPFALPALHGDPLRADEIIAIIEKMRHRTDGCMAVLLHGVGAGTHNDFIEAEEHLRLVVWIASQNSWLESVTVLEAWNRRH